MRKVHSIIEATMKEKIHPEYHDVLFVDSSTGDKFLAGSTIRTKQTMMHEGREVPVCHVPISSASHPFFTGQTKLVDAEGRVQKFNNRYAKKTGTAAK